jgi:hypothetical protein
MKGFRERIKAARTPQEARELLNEALLKVSDKAARRCQRAFDKLTFEGAQHGK